MTFGSMSTNTARAIGIVLLPPPIALVSLSDLDSRKKLHQLKLAANKGSPLKNRLLERERSIGCFRAQRAEQLTTDLIAALAQPVAASDCCSNSNFAH